MILYSLVGVGLYIGYIWFRWSNKQDEGVTKLTFKQRLHLERQEIVATSIGAILFMIGGEGVIDSACDIVGAVFGDKWSDVCISVQVNVEELIWVLGGASFGSILLFGVKFSKRKAKKKMDEL